MAFSTGNGRPYFMQALIIPSLVFSKSMDDDKPINKVVDDVLEELGHTESRAAKMDIDDLLK